MIQITTLSKVATVGTYNTFRNLDFGTVKGFNFTYDLRRVNNFEFNAAYTLQFADGTGSDARSQEGLTEKVSISEIYFLLITMRDIDSHLVRITGMLPANSTTVPESVVLIS